MTSNEMSEFITELDADMDAMEADGWICNKRGWWHPPNCVASWPWDEAREMWRKDREKKRDVRK